MNVGELIFALGFKSVGADVLKNFKKNIDGIQQAEDSANQTRVEGAKTSSVMANRLGQLGSVLTGTKAMIMATAGALVYFVKGASDAAVQIDKVQSLTGLSSGTIQRLGAMAAQTGMNIGDLTGAVSHFQRESVNIQLGRGGNIGTYQYLGIDPHEDPLKILDQLAKKLKTMPVALGTTMARDLGLSDDLIYFLKNADNLAPVSDELILSDKEIKRLKQFNFTFNKIFDQSKRVLQQFAIALAPVAESVLYFFDRMGSAFSGITQKLAKFSSSVRPYLLPLIVMGAALFAAFFPVTAAFIAIAVVLEDLWTFVNGGDSLFGRMFNWLTDINARVKDLIHFYIQLRKLMTVGDHDEYYDNMEKEMLQGADEWLKKRKEEQSSPEAKARKDGLNGAIDKQFKDINLNPSFMEDIKKLKDNVLKPLLGTGKTDTPLMPTTPAINKMGDKTSAVNNINININESKTPEQTANVLQTRLSDAFWQRQGGLA